MTRDEALTLVSRLDDRSFSDAAGTRDDVVRLFHSLTGLDRSHFLEALGAGAQSRLRQAVARAVQILGPNGDLAPLLEQWLSVETDEFARAAMEDALTPVRRTEKRKKLLADLDAVPRTYQYLADRLRHRVLNTMPGAGLSVTKLKDVAASIADDQQRHALMKEIDYLSAAFARMQRALDFVEEKTRFERAKVDLTEWLRSFVAAYRVQWQEVDVRITARETPLIIEAVPYLLETVFANLLDNSRQALGGAGTVALQMEVRSRNVCVDVSDSGDGLPDVAANVAFEIAVTTKGRRDRGRGLLEVADAMKRLGGHAEITRGAEGNRILLTFPLAK